MALERQRIILTDKEKEAKPPTTEKKIPLWEKKVALMRKTRTTPSDLYDGNPFFIEGYDDPKQPNGYTDLAKKVRFWWPSQPFLERKMILPGFNMDLYEPVTREIAQELGVKPRTDKFTPDGVYMIGDAVLYWAPEELCREQDAIMLRGVKAAEDMMKTRERMRREFQSGHEASDIAGSVVVADTEEEINEAIEKEQRDSGESIFGPGEDLKSKEADYKE